MNAPLLLGEGLSPESAARLSELAANPMVRAMLSAAHNPRNEDKRLARLLSDVQGITPAQHRLLDARPHLMGLAPGDVHIPTGLPNMFAMYANRDMIADLVLPVVSVNALSDKIWATPVTTLQTIANAQIAGSRARPNEIPYSVNSTLSYSCVN